MYDTQYFWIEYLICSNLWGAVNFFFFIFQKYENVLNFFSFFGTDNSYVPNKVFR